MNYFECEYCLKKFVKEGFFKKHTCKEMLKHKLMRKPIGLQAYNHYSTWLKLKGIREYSVEQFIDSKLFKPFIEFSQFSTRMALPGKVHFISYMIEMDIHPKDWVNTMVYDHYIKNLDNIMSPEEQFDETVDTVMELSKIYECKPNHIFRYIEPSDLIRLIQAKKLSPWFLLNSKVFHNFVLTEMTREQKALLQQQIGPSKWAKRFESYPKKNEKFRQRVAEMNF